eukprot:gene5443-biopygen14763
MGGKAMARTCCTRAGRGPPDESGRAGARRGPFGWSREASTTSSEFTDHRKGCWKAAGPMHTPRAPPPPATPWALPRWAGGGVDSPAMGGRGRARNTQARPLVGAGVAPTGAVPALAGCIGVELISFPPTCAG